MRVVDKKKARGSLKWIREAVRDQNSPLLNRRIVEQFRLAPSASISWVSPLEDDEYAEYRDESFLKRLGTELPLEKRILSDFWPKLGPQWDALGKVGNKEYLLVEAKANIPELVSSGTKAGPKSRELIERSLMETKRYLGVDPEIPWSDRLYQYSNRIAHLYLLRILNNVPARLVFVYFTGDRDVDGPTTEAEWKAAITVAKTMLGLGKRHGLSKYMTDVFIDVSELRQG